MTVEMKKRKQGGFTLLELLLVVGVGALLLIGGIATYRTVTESNRATEGTRLLLAINSEMQSLFQGRSGYGNEDHTDTLAGLNVVPSNALNPFGGTVAVQGADTEFTVTFTEIPSNACVRMARSITDPEQVESIQAGGATISNDNLRDQTFNIITPAAAGCGVDQTVDMVWTFR